MDSNLYIVRLHKGVWLADGVGDPPRTLVRDNAERYPSHFHARQALAEARTYRPFKTAEVETVNDLP